MSATCSVKHPTRWRVLLGNTLTDSSTVAQISHSSISVMRLFAQKLFNIISAATVSVQNHITIRFLVIHTASISWIISSCLAYFWNSSTESCVHRKLSRTSHKEGATGSLDRISGSSRAFVIVCSITLTVLKVTYGAEIFGKRFISFLHLSWDLRKRCGSWCR